MRKQVILLFALVAVLFGATPAFAHVAVEATDTSRGAEVSTLTFRVPNEEDGAATNQVEVFFPANVKFELVATEPIPGWAATKDAAKVTWTGGRIAPGQFQEFKIEVGPLPKTDSIVFKAIQTYDNGDVVRWIDLTPASGKEPEHPAPTLSLTAASKDEGSGSSSTTGGKSTDDVGRGLGIAAIVLSAVAIAVASRPRRTGG